MHTIKSERKYLSILQFILGMERKAVQAAAFAQQETGAAVQFHPGKNEKSPFEIFRLFQEAGGKANKAILCHTESKEEKMYI